MLLGTARLCLPLARQAITSTVTTRDCLSHLTIISVDATLIFCASMCAQQTCNLRPEDVVDHFRYSRPP
ncbi:hypothetical protein K525DRAFT_275333 [Schizophyllum commune Loenen D]|nr:hypothetical protein K525DRAFT_275333 [Schizophyllum commune Loenen D]